MAGLKPKKRRVYTSFWRLPLSVNGPGQAGPSFLSVPKRAKRKSKAASRETHPDAICPYILASRENATQS
jgi:hypothetical protein